MLDVGLLMATSDWCFARLIAPVACTTSIYLAPIKPANPSSPGKAAVLKQRERERERVFLANHLVINKYRQLNQVN